MQPEPELLAKDFAAPRRAGLSESRVAFRVWLLGLVAAYLAIRLPQLRALAVFCDEATYLDWARLIHQDFFKYAMVSVQDSKMPFHYWLLALAWPMAKDPVIMGRILSVILGGITLIPAVGICRELGRLVAVPRLFNTLFVLLVITCPLVAFNQRLALAEALLLLESLTYAWLALRCARHIGEGRKALQLALDGVVLGVIWAAALLTKQNFSYALLALLPAAFAAHIRRGSCRAQFMAFLIPFTINVVVGAAAFLPVLLGVSSPTSLLSRLLYKGQFFRDTAERGRGRIIWENFLTIFCPRAGDHWQWWPHDLAQPLDQGWLYIYVTPPIFLLSILGAGWLIYRRNWRLFIFLGIWSVGLLAPLLVANMLYSRYLLLGCIPLLIFAAWLVADLLQLVRGRLGGFWLPVAGLAIVAVLSWPTVATVAMVVDSRAPTLTRQDRFQHLSGHPSGIAGEILIDKLRALAAARPITIVTHEALLVCNEYVWLMLKDHPNIQLLRDDEIPPLRPNALESNSYLAATEQWPPAPVLPVDIRADRPIYYISAGDCREAPLGVSPGAAELGFDAVPVEIIHNDPDIPGERLIYEIQIIEILTARRREMTK